MKTQISPDHVGAIVIGISTTIRVSVRSKDHVHLGWLQRHVYEQDIFISMTELAHFIDPTVIFQKLDVCIKRVAKTVVEARDWRKALGLLVDKLRRDEVVYFCSDLRETDDLQETDG